jgi:hypothetical protein
MCSLAKHLILALILQTPLMAAAERDTINRTAFTTRYIGYSDIRRNASSSHNDSAVLSPAIEVELGFRFHTIYQFVLVGQNSFKADHKGFGAGLRIDLPGFFWLGGSRRSSYDIQRLHPVNTAVFAHVLTMDYIDSNGSKSVNISNDFGIAVDIFLFNQYVFLQGQVSLFTTDGNAYGAYGIGLGAEF